MLYDYDPILNCHYRLMVGDGRLSTYKVVAVVTEPSGSVKVFLQNEEGSVGVGIDREEFMAMHAAAEAADMAVYTRGVR